MTIPQKLMENFENCLEKNNCVRVETFYEELKTNNNLFKWSDKIKESDKFKEFMNKNIENLEVMAEGFRCLCQIHINLIRDFEIYKEYPIRKYSSAFNYISKVDGFRDYLNKLGYNEGDMKFELKVDKLKNVKEAKETALDLLICFMEIMELYRLKSKKTMVGLLINEREKNLEINMAENITDEEGMKLFKICELCGTDIDEKGCCTACNATVTEFTISGIYHKFIKRHYGLDVPKEMIPKKTEEQEVPPEEPAYKERRNSNQNKEKKDGGSWACNSCTFVNDALSFNCTICGGTN